LEKKKKETSSAAGRGGEGKEGEGPITSIPLLKKEAFITTIGKKKGRARSARHDIGRGEKSIIAFPNTGGEGDILTIKKEKITRLVQPQKKLPLARRDEASLSSRKGRMGSRQEGGETHYSLLGKERGRPLPYQERKRRRKELLLKVK